jgi:hypothetical protein
LSAGKIFEGSIMPVANIFTYDAQKFHDFCFFQNIDDLSTFFTSAFNTVTNNGTVLIKRNSKTVMKFSDINQLTKFKKQIEKMYGFIIKT